MIITGPGTADAEARRAEAVRDTGLWDSDPEPEFDELVELAAEICGAPISAITLLDETHQFIKAVTSDVQRILPREGTFCTYALEHADGLTVPDTHLDAQFANHPMVTAEGGVRFYTGIPVRTEAGLALGTLCVADTQPRELTARQQRALRVLARQVEARMQLRTRMQQVRAHAAELKAQHELLRHFLDDMPMEAALKDAQGRIVFYNKAIAEHFKISRTEWLGKTDLELWGPEKGALMRAEEDYVLQSEQTHEMYTDLPSPDGEDEYWKIIRSAFRLPGGEQVLATIGVNLTTELQREAQLVKLQEALEDANRKLRSLSLTDELTGLWNRRAFDARLETELFLANLQEKPLTLLILDVDNFKSLNDTYGHTHGDEVLAEVGAALRRTSRVADVAVRYGGEEFAVILPDTDLEGGCSLAERMRQALAAICWKHRAVTVSVGIATHAPGQTSDDLLNQADAAMYRAKRTGKDRACMWGDHEVAPVTAAEHEPMRAAA